MKQKVAVVNLKKGVCWEINGMPRQVDGNVRLLVLCSGNVWASRLSWYEIELCNLMTTQVLNGLRDKTSEWVRCGVRNAPRYCVLVKKITMRLAKKLCVYLLIFICLFFWRDAQPVLPPLEGRWAGPLCFSGIAIILSGLATLHYRQILLKIILIWPFLYIGCELLDLLKELGFICDSTEERAGVIFFFLVFFRWWRLYKIEHGIIGSLWLWPS